MRRITRRKNGGKLPKGFRFTGALAASQIGMIPVVDFQNLRESGKHACAPFFWRGKHRFAMPRGYRATKLKHLNARCHFKFDSQISKFIPPRDVN